ncbi:MAG TPA: serine hydrolase [Terriglobales bacterium]|nr:serine hydrolase [Terriglobales bacterium]
MAIRGSRPRPLVGSVAFLLLLVSFSRSMATPAAPSDAAIRAMLKERVDIRPNTGIVVGILEAGRRHVVAFGTAGPDGKPALDGDTVFEIGSVTKVFTAALLADMVARGEVKYDDPVSKFLPATVKVPSRGGKVITLVDLATQSSGLPRMPSNFTPKDPKNPYGDYSVQQMYDFLSSYHLTRDIGAQYEYSNLGVGLLGHALALRAGMSYEQLVTARILKPLGMNDTVITLSPRLRARLAIGHEPTGEPVANWDIPTLAGAGALRSTVNDMMKFLAANLDVKRSGLPAALRDTHKARHATTTPGLSIGLGWHIRQLGDVSVVWHNGGTGGYHSFIGFDERTRAGVVVLHNSSGSIDDIGFHLVNAGFPVTPPPAPRKEVTVDPKVLQTYVGEYALSPAFVIAVTLEGNALFIQASGQSKLPVFAESETEFFLKVVDAQISFVKGEGGTVTGLVLHQNGQNQPGKKIK